MTNSKNTQLMMLLIAIGLATFSLGAATTGLITELPKIQAYLQVSSDNLQWMINAYTITAATLIILVGRLGDALDKGKMFAVGLAIMCICSFLLTVTESFSIFILLRILQSIGSVIIVPVGLSIINTSFPKEKKEMASGLWAAFFSLSTGLGPVLGGVSMYIFSWKLLLYVISLICILALILFLSVRKQFDFSPDKNAPKTIDVVGLVLLVFTILPIIYALTQGRSLGWGNPLTISLIIIGFIFLTLLYLFEKNYKKKPLINFSHLSNKTFIVPLLMGFVSFFALNDILYFFSVFSQNSKILNYSPLSAGLSLLPVTLVLFVFSFITPKLFEKFKKPKYLYIISLLILAVGFFVLAQLTSSISYYDIWYSFVLIGLGLSVTNVLSPGIAISVLPKEEAGEASGIVSLGLYLGITIGIALGSITYNRLDGNLLMGFKQTMYLNLIVVLIGLVIVSLFGIKGNLKRES